MHRPVDLRRSVPDVQMGDGTQLEFTLAKTGLGKSFAAEVTKRRQQHGRSR